eukprot:96851_1
MSAEFKPHLSKHNVAQLASYYGIQIHMIHAINELSSYDDQVFHVDVKPEYCTQNIFSVILKCSMLCDLNRIDLWIKLANHLIKHNMPTAKPILLLKQYVTDHECIYTIKPSKNNDKPIYIHCAKYIKGRLANTIKHTPIFLNHLGNTIANIHKTLYNKFRHNDAEWADDWCLGFADKAIDSIDNLNQILDYNSHRLNIVKYYRNNFEVLLKPKMKYMPQCIVLGDINDSNIMCDYNDNARIIAVFDFGESHKTVRMFDLAICCAYFMMNKTFENGLNTMKNIIKGYHKVLPLNNDEIDTIFVAICSRWMVSAVLGIKNAKDNPENPWLLHHATHAWNALNQYLTVHPNEVATCIRKCLYESSL